VILNTRPNIGRLRFEANIAQSALANRSGLSLPTVWKAENGHTSPKVAVAWRIVHALRALTGKELAFEDVWPS